MQRAVSRPVTAVRQHDSVSDLLGVVKSAAAALLDGGDDSDESDDATEIAGRGVRMAGNEPGGYRINPNGQDVDYFDSDGNLSAQYHGSHGDPHGHNFNNFD